MWIVRGSRVLAALTALCLLAGCAVDSTVEAAASHGDALEDLEHDHDESDAPSGPEERAPSRPATLSRGAFGFTTLDVGQGDAAVVLSPRGCVALLDGGPTGSGKSIKHYLRSLSIDRIDFAVVSHYHEDHMGGIDEVEEGDDAIPIGKVYDHGGSYNSGAYRQYDRQFRGRRVATATGDAFSLCDEVDFEVVASNANGQATSDENARSVVVKVTYGELDVLVGGDLTFGGPNMEASVAAEVGPIEIYKVHHHGAAGSSSARFLEGTMPTVSLISVAQNNSYGHPTEAALSRLSAVGSDVWRTAGTAETRGHLEVVSTDGSSFTVTKNDLTSTYRSKPAPSADTR